MKREDNWRCRPREREDPIGCRVPRGLRVYLKALRGTSRNQDEPLIRTDLAHVNDVGRGEGRCVREPDGTSLPPRQSVSRLEAQDVRDRYTIQMTAHLPHAQQLRIDEFVNGFATELPPPA